MATVKLTKTAVDGAAPAPKNIFLWDADLRGFGLKVTPAGNKVFLIQYRMGGRGAPTRRYTIGTYGSPWTPKGARDEAERLLIQVRQGVDPGEHKVDRLRMAVTLAFSDYADKFLADYVKSNWKASYGDAERIVRLHLKPALRSKALPAIRKSDIAALYDAIPVHQIALRRKVYAILSRLFRWAVGRGDLDRSPLEGAEPPPSPQSRDRWLSDVELRLAWLAAGDLGYPFGPLYRLLISTGQRREEVSGLDWKELHRDAKEWRLPGTRAKNGEPTTTHLNALAVAALDGVAGGAKWPRRGLVFTTTGETTVSGYSRGKARLDAAMLKLAQKEADAESAEAEEEPEPVELERWRVHDLRRTLATGMQRLGVRFEVVENVLNHVSGSRAGVAGVYQRHNWRDESRAALDAWAAHIKSLIGLADETNVIALAERRA